MSAHHIGSNWDRMHSSFIEVGRGQGMYEFKGKRKLTAKEKRERIMNEYHAREKYRGYGAHRVSFFSVIYRTVAVAILGYFFAALYLSFLVISFIAFAFYGGPLISFVVLSTAFIIIVSILSKPYFRRRKFVKRLKKMAKERKIKVYRNRSLYRNVRRPSGVCDLTVEVGHTVYDVMFFPTPRRLAVIRFTEPHMAQVITGVLKNRFKLMFGSHERVKFVSYAFEGGRYSSKNHVKVLLMNPAPYSMQSYDEKEGKMLESGSGAEFFGYAAYSGTGFVDLLERELEKPNT